MAILNSHAWITMKRDGREFGGRSSETTEVLVAKRGIPLDYNKFRWSIHVNFYEGATDTQFVGLLSCKEYFNAPVNKCFASHDWRYYVLLFEGEKFIICSLTNKDNKVAILYSTDMHPDLELSLQFPTADSCVVTDKAEREIFVCNATTRENNLLVPRTIEVHSAPVSKKKDGRCSII